MSTVPNTTVILYKGVPLVKGGMEVLYLSGASAAAAIASKAYKTISSCTYVREEKSYVRVPATVSECEGCNYLSFRNANHGGKYYFGFIDRIRYVNEATSQIDFTIDPFPTYSGDATELPLVHLKRNTIAPGKDVRGNNLQVDYVPDSAKQEYTALDSKSWTADSCYMYYAIGNTDYDSADMMISAGSAFTGIHVGLATAAKIKAIQEDGGVIIGAYMMPASFFQASAGFFGNNLVRSLGSLTGDPLAHVSTYTHAKIKTGVYNTVMLFTSQGAKSYELELFSNVNSVSFECVGLMTPGPSIFIYPLNYKGIAKNLAEGMYLKFPAIPITANAVYSNTQYYEELYSSAMGGILGGMKGISGGAAAGLMGAGLGMLLPGVRGAFEENVLTKYKPPAVKGSGDPVVATDMNVWANLVVSSPSQIDLNRISKFFDYYGYNIDAVETNTGLADHVYTGDGAFIQTGTPLFAGSEADDQLNARAAAGMKIRKSFS